MVPPHPSRPEEVDAVRLIADLENFVREAQDNLLMAKVQQASHANRSRGPEVAYEVGDRVKLSTVQRRHEYKQKGEYRVAKFMPRFDGPYTITEVHAKASTYTLDMPNSPNIYPVFHSSELLPYHLSDAELFPSREFARPAPIITDDGPEWTIEDIVASRRCGRGWRYLVRWKGYGAEEDCWLPGAEVADCKALDRWLASGGNGQV